MIGYAIAVSSVVIEELGCSGVIGIMRVAMKEDTEIGWHHC